MRIARVLMLPLIALFVAGCGSDDGSSSKQAVDTDTTPATQSTGATTETTPSTGASAGAPAPGATLTGSVGPGFDISLSDASGKPVSTLKAGAYTIRVDDESDIHNFHLTGPGVDESTAVDRLETKTWKVTLAAGEYIYQCDPHASQMHSTIAVT